MEFKVNDKHEDNHLALGTTVLKNKIIPSPNSNENKEMASFLLQKKQRLHQKRRDSSKLRITH